MTQGSGTGATVVALTANKSSTQILGWLWVFLVAFMLVGIGGQTVATPPKFSFKKNFCSGNPLTLINPGNCALAPTTPMNTPVYYTFTLTNPWSQPQQIIDIVDPQMSNMTAFGFTPSGPIFCKDDLGAPVTLVPSTVSGSLGQITLDIDRTVTCFAPGKFTTSGTKTNNAQGQSKLYTLADQVTTEVLATSPLNADLSVVKTVSPNALDLTTGADTTTYTITIKNNGPADVDIGNWFTLHDRLSLLPNSVPLNVEYVSSNCAVTASTSGPANECLDAAGPNLTGANPTFVGTMGYTNFFNWKFASGAAGHLQVGATMTLTITVRISALDGCRCTKALNANGIRNETFFTLANANSALTEINPANNTSFANVAVQTGETFIDPDCGEGKMKITKEQVTPTTSPVAWGTPVTYRIVIENTALPAQKITIGAQGLKDTS